MKHKYITATEARKQLFDLIEQTKKSEQPVYITLKGIPEAVLVSREAYDGLIATLETYEDPELVEAIKEGMEDIKAGRVTPWEEVKKELGLTDTDAYMVAEKAKKTYVSGRTHRKGKERAKKTR